MPTLDFKRASLTLRPNQSRMYDFPGGTVEIARTSDGDYWAHLSITRHDAYARTDYEITGSRIDSAVDTLGIYDVPHTDTLTHIALRITPTPKVTR